jgi:DNA replication protein DnaC
MTLSAPDDIERLLKELGFKGMQLEFAACLHNAEQENWGYRRFLTRLLEIEAALRLSRRVERLLGEAELPAEFTFQHLSPQKFNEKPRRMLPTLLTGDFVKRGDNLICFGLPGRGKSHFCAAIGRELIRQHQMKVWFTPAFRLVSQLLQAKAVQGLPKYLEKLHKFDVIILDDIGYVQHTADEMEVLFTFIAERYQHHRTLMLTSNLVFSQWDRIFKNPMTAMAAVDRLTHRGIILEFELEHSIRAEHASRLHLNS